MKYTLLILLAVVVASCALQVRPQFTRNMYCFSWEDSNGLAHEKCTYSRDECMHFESMLRDFKPWVPIIHGCRYE